MNKIMDEYPQRLETALGEMDGTARTQALNTIRQRLHTLSPFCNEPVDCVLWLPAGKVRVNDYNLNVVDSYHRMQLGKHKPRLKELLKGYLLVVLVHGTDR
ncbi:hypothetical protein ACQ5DV_005169 [Salmonella enterica subsp. enterica]